MPDTEKKDSEVTKQAEDAAFVRPTLTPEEQAERLRKLGEEDAKQRSREGTAPPGVSVGVPSGRPNNR